LKASLIKGGKMEALNGMQSSLPAEVTIAVHQELQFFLLKAPLKTGFVTLFTTQQPFFGRGGEICHTQL
jgi:hypothetical protein